jgi:hypothetical protein
VSGYGLDDRGDRGSIPGRGERISSLACVSRPALGPTQAPVQWVPRVLSPGLKRGRGVTLTTHPHLMPRSGMSRSYSFSPPSACLACSGTALAFLLSNKTSRGTVLEKPILPQLIKKISSPVNQTFITELSKTQH